MASPQRLQTALERYCARNPPAQYRSSAVWSLWGEATLALYFWVCIAAAGWSGRWWSLPFLYLFAQGYSLMVLGGTLPRFGHGKRLP